MTVVQPNSIAGINSISVQSGNALNLHKSDGTLIRTLVAESGISTYSSISVGSATTDNNADKSINIGLGASISQHSDNTLSFGTNGDERARIDSNGRLGINENSPDRDLHISNTTPYIRVESTSANQPATLELYHTRGNGSDKWPSSVATTDAALLLNVAAAANGTPAERARINSSGNVGVNTDFTGSQTWRNGKILEIFGGGGNVTGELHLGANRGDSNQSVGSINFFDNSQDSTHRHIALIEADKSGSTSNKRGGDLIFFTKNDNVAAPTEKVRIDSSGNTNIGAAAANTTIHASGLFNAATPKFEVKLGAASNSYTRLINITNPGAQTNSETLGRVGIKLSLGSEASSGESNKSGIIYAESTSGYNNSVSLCLATSNAERARITSTGLVGINSTTPSKQLEVQGLDVALRLKSTVATGRIGMEFYDTAAQKGFLGYPSSGNDQMSLQQNEAADFYCYVNGADRLRIRADGRVAIASSLAVTGVCTATAFVADYLDRNLLINGAMEYRQRDTPHTGTGFVVDRWRTAENTGGSVSTSQEIDGPPGLYNCVKVDCTGDDTSLASSEYTFFEQKIEALKTRQLGWGTSGARPVTVSFWVKSDKLGTYSVAICNSANDRAIVKDYTVSASNTWTRYILTFSGDTSGTWLKNESSIGLRLRFGLASGTTYTTGTLGSWVAADIIGSTNMLNFMDSTSNDWFITGVQLELGEHATPYEYRDHAREQNDCFRYYLRYKPGLRGVTSYVGTSDINATTNICNGIAYDADDAHFTKTFPVPMCKEPTIDTFTDMRIIQGGSLLDTATVIQNQNSSLDTLDLHVDNGGSVANYGCFLGCKTESSDFVLNAEI